MRRVLAVFVAICLSLPIAPATSAPTNGKVCQRQNQVKLNGATEYICKKSAGKLKWRIVKSKPSFNPDPRPAGPIFKNDCEPDPLVPKQWEIYQQNVPSNYCSPPYRYLVKTLTTETPNTIPTPQGDLLPINQCKLQRGEGWDYERRNGTKLNPNIVVQLIPFATTDYPATTDPRVDWKDYIDFIVDSLTKMTDVPSNYQFRIAPKYFPIDKKLVDYGLSALVSHGDASANGARNRLAKDVLAVADAEINFSDVNKVFFISPTTVPRSVLANQIGWGERLATTEKIFENGIYITSYINDFKSPYWHPREPFAFIHEMMHIFNTAEDYYGDADYGGNEVGAGNWGNMSRGRMDHLVWDKWSAQMIADDQVRCVSITSKSVHWIKPSTIQGNHEKLVLIPLNRYEAIAIESIRASGFNYKIPAKQHGALVYRLNTAEIDDHSVHGDGLRVLCPTNRTCNKQPDPEFRGFRLATATLKAGDYLDHAGIRIKLVEAGDYGDVVSIEPINN